MKKLVYPIRGSYIRDDIINMIKKKPKKVLSIGCGVGSTEAEIREKGIEIWGIDISVEAMTIAKEKLDKAIVGDIENDDMKEIPNRYFDIVICGDILEHLRNPEYILERIHKWINNDGEIIISVPNFCHYSVMIELMIKRDWTYRNGGLFDRDHLRIFTRKSFIRMVERMRYKVVDIGEVTELPTKSKFIKSIIAIINRIIPSTKDYFVQQWIIRARENISN
jgi:2-polyprenyl-3-methyl-5-hydroxy-6-metoxy-1,4-benzoquinol methylase